MNQTQQHRARQLEQVGKLLDIMDELRAGCPWDQKQTMETLRPLTIEETYELADAILNEDMDEIKKELGDLLLHIVFYAKIGSEKKAFDLGDIAHAISKKLIHRHPHIYGDVHVENEEDVKKNWEKLKLKEGRTSVLEGVPSALPALVKAVRIQEKAAGIGFDWENREQVWEKVKEEIEELKIEVSNNDAKKKESEFGDVLFALINYARFINVSPENALEQTNKKFINRFHWMEKEIKSEAKLMQEMNLEQLDHYWNLAKKIHP